MKRLLSGMLVFLAGVVLATSAEAPSGSQERLTYGVEWKLLHAGTAVMETRPGAARLTIESAGFVSALIKIKELYNVAYEDSVCASGSTMDSLEGKRHHETTITFDRRRGRALFLERDLVKNTTVRDTSIETPRCVQDALGGLLRMRDLKLEPGQTAQVPISDGRKSASVKIEAQARETIKTPAGSFPAIRYEANLLNGVIYSRAGRVFVWVSEDQQRLPVRIELRLSFPAGTVTLDLQKAEHF